MIEVDLGTTAIDHTESDACKGLVGILDMAMHVFGRRNAALLATCCRIGWCATCTIGDSAMISTCRIVTGDHHSLGTNQ